MAEKLRPVRCKRCNRLFHLCRSCDRGQSYCSDACREGSRQERVERARRKYARSEKGKQNNRDRQRRFRKRKSLKFQCLNKRVTDPSSQGALAVVCLRRERAGRVGPRDVFGEKRAHSAGVGSRISRENRPETDPETDDSETIACCHVCGRPGVVFRQKRRRGRFRWFHL